MTNPQEMELTPKRKRSICTRRMEVAISPMLVSPLKVRLKSPPHQSLIVTLKGMQQLNSNKVRLKNAIASRRLKLQEKVQKRGGDP